MQSTRAIDRLVRGMDRAGTCLCVGLDPVIERMPAALAGLAPAERIERFCVGVLDAIADVCAVVKPQSACFERYGWRGVAAMERVCAGARERGLFVLLDAKRGDIGVSAEHYAASACGMGADAITLNGYLGMETIAPYIERGLGAFVLVRTSNPGGDSVQSHRLGDGRSVAEMMADEVRAAGESCVGASGLSDIGAVVGATKSAEASALRDRMQRTMFLVPGFGAQGGTADDVRRLSLAGGRGVVANASRSVLYPTASAGNGAWEAAVAEAARAAARELRIGAADQPRPPAQARA